MPVPFTFTVGAGVTCALYIQFESEVSGQDFVSRMPITIRLGTSSTLLLLDDDVDSGTAAWVHGSGIKKKKYRIDTWVISERRFRSGTKSWFTPNLNKVTDAFLDTPRWRSRRTVRKSG